MTNTQDELERFREQAVREIAPRLAHRMDLESLAVIHRNAHEAEPGVNRLDLLVHRDGIPEATFLPGPHRTLRYITLEGWDMDLESPAYTTVEQYRELWAPWTIEQVLALPGAAGLEEYRRELEAPGAQWGEPQETVNEITSRAIGMSIGQSDSSRPDSLDQTVREMMDEGIIERAAQLANPFTLQDECTLHQYNAVAVYGDLLEEMMAQEPVIATVWLNCLLREEGSPPRPRTLTGMAWTARRALGLRRAEWRNLLRTGLTGLLNAPYLFREEQEIQLATRAVTQANLNEYCQDFAEEVWQMQDQNNTIGALRWDHGDPMRAWGHIIRQAMLAHLKDPTLVHLAEPPGERRERYVNSRMERWNELQWGLTRCRGDARRLRNVGHSLTGYIRNQWPWTKAGWEGYLRRTQEWEDLTLLEKVQGVCWESLIGEFNSHELTVRPVTTGEELWETAREMRNCLNTYQDDCLQNGKRVFRILQNGRLTAAGEINRNGERWSLGQVQGPMNEPAPRAAREAMLEAVRHYQEAQKGLRRTAG